MNRFHILLLALFLPSCALSGQDLKAIAGALGSNTKGSPASVTALPPDSIEKLLASKDPKVVRSLTEDVLRQFDQTLHQARNARLRARIDGLKAYLAEAQQWDEAENERFEAHRARFIRQYEAAERDGRALDQRRLAESFAESKRVHDSKLEQNRENISRTKDVLAALETRLTAPTGDVDADPLGPPAPPGSPSDRSANVVPAAEPAVTPEPAMGLDEAKRIFNEEVKTAKRAPAPKGEGK